MDVFFQFFLCASNAIILTKKWHETTLQMLGLARILHFYTTRTAGYRCNCPRPRVSKILEPPGSAIRFIPPDFHFFDLFWNYPKKGWNLEFFSDVFPGFAGKRKKRVNRSIPETSCLTLKTTQRERTAAGIGLSMVVPRWLQQLVIVNPIGPSVPIP